MLPGPIRNACPQASVNTGMSVVNATAVVGTPSKPVNRTAPGWPLFCDAIDQPGLVDEPRFATHASRGDHLDDLYEVVRPIIKAKPTEWLAARLTERGIMNGKVNTYREFLTEDQVAAAWQHCFEEMVKGKV